jgi:hypothetical protein
VDDVTGCERRVGRRLRARGEEGLFEALLVLRGTDLGEGLRLDRLLAVGGEGAVFTVADAADPAARLVGKIGLVSWHRPVRLTSKVIRARRAVIEDEADILEQAGSPFLPGFRALAEFGNPLLEAARGGEFAEPEPCLVMERLPGQDLDAWLCRVHRGDVDRDTLRRSLDRIAVGMLQALADLEKRGFLYADLRPGNFRVWDRPRRRVRLLDAGGCVPSDSTGRRFPYVPSYLPPRVFRAVTSGETLVASPRLQASMAGRTLYEVATGQAPKAASYLDMQRLARSPVSPPVAEVIAALANENYYHCASALRTLADRARA